MVITTAATGGAAAPLTLPVILIIGAFGLDAQIEQLKKARDAAIQAEKDNQAKNLKAAQDAFIASLQRCYPWHYGIDGPRPGEPPVYAVIAPPPRGPTGGPLED
jgi:hypothetical protein